MAKKDATVTVAQNEVGNIVVTVKGAAENGGDVAMTLDLTKVHDANKAYAAFHGFKQRLVDTAAMSADIKTGLAATPAKKASAIGAIIAHLESGTEKWKRVSEGGPEGGLLFEALCELFGHQKAPSEIRAWLDGLSDKEQAALRMDEQVLPVIERLKAAKPKVKSDVDTKSLIAGLTAPKA